MKSTGIIRKIDQLGRIVLPIELRRHLEIEKGDDVEIFVDGNTVVLEKYNPRCVFCGNSDNLIEFCGKNVCAECRAKLK